LSHDRGLIRKRKQLARNLNKTHMNSVFFVNERDQRVVNKL